MVKMTIEEFRQLSAYIYDHYGIYIKPEKKEMLIGRLRKIIEPMGIESFEEYYRYLVHDKTGEASNQLVNHVTTNHTYFMRETTHFSFLHEVVLPQLKVKIKDKDLRIWCAACSSGEEAYTLAMILDEVFGGERYAWDKKLLATDLSNKALEKARAGIYLKKDVAQLPDRWRMNYFKSIDVEQYQVKDTLKKEVIYRRFNLKEQYFPFKKKFHVIFCRNVMIYFDEKTKDGLIQKFYDSLEVGGYLFVGQSEALNVRKYGFTYVQPSVYKKE